MASRDEKKLLWRAQIQLACDQIIPWHPKTILLIGSMARYLMGLDTGHTPKDIDLVVVGDNPLLDVESNADKRPIELHRYQTEEMVRIAYSLRYDARSVALSKLYGKNVIKQHSRDVIAAALLLGDNYNEFGIEQIDIDGQMDQRNYAIHEVLYGKRWWQALRRYTTQRRGPLGWVTDKMFHLEEFEV